MPDTRARITLPETAETALRMLAEAEEMTYAGLIAQIVLEHYRSPTFSARMKWHGLESPVKTKEKIGGNGRTFEDEFLDD